jgi:hypothetical protein
MLSVDGLPQAGYLVNLPKVYLLKADRKFDTINEEPLEYFGV